MHLSWTEMVIVPCLDVRDFGCRPRLTPVHTHTNGPRVAPIGHSFQLQLEDARCHLKMELISKLTYACVLPMILIPELERLKNEANPKHPYRN